MLTITIQQISLTSFALAVNKIALIRSITVKNDTPNNYEDLRVKITFDPEFADTTVEHITSLRANESWHKPDIQPSFNTSYLCNLTEKITAKTTVQLLNSNDEVLAEAKSSVDVLDSCQYWGNSFMSQYLAAFVTPRHIALDPIIKRASELLAEWTGSSSLSAYLRDVPNRPRMIVGAIYEAIAEQNITYCDPTSTLATFGQKIRTCEELLSAERGKRGCCLDMALLMCSCLEAVGLNPLLIVQDNHAFAGCWLIQEMFNDSVNDDPSLVTKRIAEGINSIVLVEMTMANEGKSVSFDSAVMSANDSIKNIENFAFVLDVARARAMGIQPIPQRIYNGHEYVVVNNNTEELQHQTPGAVSETFVFSKDGTNFNRFDLWERRLLDLTTRNNLLNSRFSKNTLRLMTTSLEEIVSLLDKDKEISILESPAEWKTNIRSNDLEDRIKQNDPVMELLRKDMERYTLRSHQDLGSLSRTLTSLFRTARLAIEESGANTLYIALGFLKWYEQGKAFPYFAPIVLYPIRIERKSANKGYCIVSRDEDPLLNETLFELLKQNYDITIPDVSAAIHNEKGLDIKYILAAIRKAIMEQDKWDVVDEATISIFDFNRFVIWNDLRTNREAMATHPLINSLVNGKLDEALCDEDDNAQTEVASEDVALPISAESSQLAAIHKAASGKSFVLHGPPGTGKSQTITNIISNALFHGKRVLFVAEKMAALEVVQKRLASIGLAPFCLELHSNKTKKSLVMDQLRKTTEVAQLASNGTFTKEAAQLDALKQELNAHIERLHKMQSCGLSVYDCFVRYSEIDVPDSATIKIGNELIEKLNGELLREFTELVENYESVAGMISEYNNELREIDLLEYSPELRAEIQSIIDDILPIIVQQQKLHSELTTAMSLTAGALSQEQYAALGAIVEIYRNSEIPSALIANLNEDLLGTLRDLATIKQQLCAIRSELLSMFSEHILDVDYKALRMVWIEAEHKWFMARYFDRRGVVNRLSSYALNGKRVEKESVLETLTKLDTVHRLQQQYDELIGHADRLYNIKRELTSAEADELNTYYEQLSTLLRLSNSVAQQWQKIKSTNRTAISSKLLADYCTTYS